MSNTQLKAAKNVQAQLLPRDRPAVPGYRFLDYYQAANEIGGDYYGYFKFPDGRIAVAVADVCGKGLPAALTMAELSSEVRRSLETEPSLKQAMSQLRSGAPITVGNSMWTYPTKVSA